MAVLIAQAQTTFATITGTVTDPSGLVVAAAHVTGTQLESGYKYEAQTNQNGVYTLPNLREGAYTVDVAAAGFHDSEVRNVQLVSRDVRRLDVKLEVGAVTTAVEVSGGGATLIETETARISQTRGARELKDLPLNTRGLTSFLSLTPGVAQATTVTATRRFAGSRRNQSDVAVDGVTTTASNGTQISPIVSYIESFEEVRVDMANNTAENEAIGQVTVISKSGTNDLHGSLFDYYVTPFFRARDPFSPKRASGIRHEPGVSLGGPVVLPHVYDGHNRTFFFASFETNRGSITQQLFNPSVPLAAWRNGDFSNLLPATVIKDPKTGAPFPGNIIPQSRLNPVSTKLQSLFYPLPNSGNPNAFASSNFREILTHQFDPNNYWTGRLDHRFSDRAFVFGRYTWDRTNNTNYDGSLPTLGRIHDIRDTRSIVASWTQVIKSNLSNELRYGYAFSNEPRWGPQNGLAIANELGLQGLLPDLPNLPGLLNVTFSGLGLTSISQTQYGNPGFYNKMNEVQDYVSWFHGKHSVKAGVRLARYSANGVTAPLGLYGNLQFTNRFTGFAYSDFLLGIPTTANRAGPPLNAPFLRNSYDFFVTDEYKITPKLTMNIGMRYELHPNWSSGNGLASLFDIGTGRIVVEDGSQSKVSPLTSPNVTIVEASKAGYSGGALIQTDRNNFAPRIGAAWRPFGEKTVIRAGFGIFYDIVPTAVNMAGAPFSVSDPPFTNPTTNPTVILPTVFPNSAGTTLSLPGAFKKDLRIPYSIQYNFTVERQIAQMGVRMSYIGTGTRQGQYAYNYNQPVADTRLYVDKPRPFPNYPAISYTTNGAGHQYNSLNVEVKRRFASGFLYDFSWVWQRDIGDLERDQTPENSYNLHRERAVWEDLPTHRVTADFVYELPFGKGKRFLGGSNRWLNLAVGGWGITSVYVFNTGQFLTPLWTGPDPTGTAFTSSKTPASVTIRPNILHDPNLAAGRQSIGDWFDLSAFSAPSPGAFGTSAKGVIVGPGSWIIDSGLYKNFSFSERVRLRWELTATNVLNHPNYADPGLNITSAGTAGVITAVGGTTGGGGLDASGQRSLRMGVRVEW